MRSYNEDNERTKRTYMIYLKEAKGQDEKSIDKVLAAVVRFEESTKFKPFKKFHIEQAAKFKACLAKAKNERTGKPLSQSTIDATLRLVKGFFHWLAGQTGFKSKITYPDVEYFNNNTKNARAAHAQRDIPYLSMEQTFHAFQAMPNESDFEKRDKALFAFFMLTMARDGAVASLKIKHINIEEGHVFQDGRDVKTKNSKTIDTWFYPVDTAYRDCFEDWFNYLKHEKLFGPEDALFPKPLMGLTKGGGFTVLGLSRDTYSNSAKLNAIIRNAFAMVQMPEYTPHSFRKTLGLLSNKVCRNLEEFKAWSMNMGHDNLATTVSSYMPVTRQRQRDLILGMKR